MDRFVIFMTVFVIGLSQIYDFYWVAQLENRIEALEGKP